MGADKAVYGHGRLSGDGCCGTITFVDDGARPI